MTLPSHYDMPGTWGHSAPETPEIGHVVIIPDITSKFGQVMRKRDNQVQVAYTGSDGQFRLVWTSTDTMSYIGMNPDTHAHTWHID